MQYQYNSEKGQMEEVKGRVAKKVEKIALEADLAQSLKEFAIADKIPLNGISYLTEKDAEGKTKKDADGKPVFQTDKDGKKKTVAITESSAKVNSAISMYVNAVIAIFVASRHVREKGEDTQES